MVNSRENLPFLDVNIRLKEGYFIPEIYSKATDSHEYLNRASCHPPSVTNNNPLGVALRADEIVQIGLKMMKYLKVNLYNTKHISCIRGMTAS